jgi:hypothetical protein
MQRHHPWKPSTRYSHTNRSLVNEAVVVSKTHTQPALQVLNIRTNVATCRFAVDMLTRFAQNVTGGEVLCDVFVVPTEQEISGLLSYER